MGLMHTHVMNHNMKTSWWQSTTHDARRVYRLGVYVALAYIQPARKKIIY